MRVVEFVTHKLVVPFQILYKKEGKLHKIWPFFPALLIWRDIYLYRHLNYFFFYPLPFDEIFLTAEMRKTRKITIRKTIS